MCAILYQSSKIVNEMNAIEFSAWTGVGLASIALPGSCRRAMAGAGAYGEILRSVDVHLNRDFERWTFE